MWRLARRRLLVLLAVGGGVARADEPPRPAPAAPAPAPKPSPPPTPEQAADAALVAIKSNDSVALKALAAKDEPDPWLVADELVRRGDFDAADTFATSAPRKDVEQLPGYVASQRGKPDDAVARAALAKSTIASDPKAALAVVDGVPRGSPTVSAVRLEFVRGLALRSLRRLEESAAAFAGAADGSAGFGWISMSARALDEAAKSAWMRSDFPGALAYLERGIEVFRRRGDRAGTGKIQANVGLVLQALGRLAEAREALEQALQVAEELGDRASAARTLGNLGTLHQSLGDYANALESYERALREKTALGDRRGAAGTLANVGSVRAALGEFPAALDALGKALSEQEAIGDRDGAAMTLGTIGTVHDSLGNYAKALDALERSLKEKEALGNRAGAAATRSNIATVHRSLGNFAKALELHERVLKQSEALADRVRASATMTNIGNVYLDLGNPAKALEFYERALREKEALGDRPGAAVILGNMGTVHFLNGDFEKAREFHERARAAQEALGNRAATARHLSNLGADFAGLGDFAKALEFHERALKEAEALGDRAAAATILGNIGHVHDLLGDSAKAVAALDKATREAQRLHATPTLVTHLALLARARLSSGDAARALSDARRAIREMETLASGLGEEESGQMREQFSLAFDVGAAAAARLSDVVETAFFLESGRAGSLLDSLVWGESMRGAGLSEELRTALAKSEAAERNALSAYGKALERGADLETIRSAGGDVDAARERIRDTVARIRREAKQEAAVFFPQSATLEEIQGSLEDGEALILVGPVLEEALALVMTRAEARIVSLGKARDLEAACEALSILPDEDPTKAIAALQQIVVRPLALPPAVRRVLVSPTGALSYVPFALLLPDRDVAYVPSGTTLVHLGDERSKRGVSVLALGDPEYGAGRSEEATTLYWRGRPLAALPATKEEAKTVGERPLLGKDATEAGLRKAVGAAKGERWRSVHFACHGLIDPESPFFSSLALTPSGDDDGFLTGAEILRMKVPADLVVLSACETGKGRVVRGEGIVGLTSAFMLAGAPRVLCSLWKVDDEATRALMVRFYELWNPKSGQPALGTAEALRKAQEFVRSQEKWKHPYYWAAWVLWGLPS